MSAFDSAVAADFNPHRLKQVVVIWGGTNDLYHGASGATAYTRLLARVNAYKAAGYTKIIVVNCLKRIDSGTPGGYETERADFNSRVAAGVATEGWVLADIAAVTNLQDPSNTTYFLDGVHLSGTGQDQMSPVVRDAVNAA
jgi:lysophospholipase L1-like esterase